MASTQLGIVAFTHSEGGKKSHCFLTRSFLRYFDSKLVLVDRDFYSDWKVADASRNYTADNANFNMYTADTYQYPVDSSQLQEVRIRYIH